MVLLAKKPEGVASLADIQLQAPSSSGDRCSNICSPERGSCLDGVQAEGVAGTADIGVIRVAGTPDRESDTERDMSRGCI